MSTSQGTFADHVTNPSNLTDDHLAKSVAILVPECDHFELELGVVGGFAGSGRNMQLVGATNAVCPRRAMCDSYVCPAGSVLTRRANVTNCHFDVCAQRDADRCCEKVAP